MGALRTGIVKSIRNKNCWEKSVVKNNMVFQQSVVVLAFITLSFGAETCYDGPGGASPTEGRAGGHNIQVTKAMISKPAPPFSGTAVLNGEFTELLAFNDRVQEFRNIGAEVVACSVDSHFTHLAWMSTPRTEGGLGKLDIPLLSDLTHTISKDYGVYLEENGHT